MTARLVVKTVTPLDKFPVDVYLSATVEELKEQVAPRAGMPKEAIRLVSAGRIWQDGQTVAHYEPRQHAAVLCLGSLPRSTPAPAGQTPSVRGLTAPAAAGPADCEQRRRGPEPGAADGWPPGGPWNLGGMLSDGSTIDESSCSASGHGSPRTFSSMGPGESSPCSTTRSDGTSPWVQVASSERCGGYYWDPRTGESRWTLPPQEADNVAWMAQRGNSGELYYWNQDDLSIQSEPPCDRIDTTVFSATTGGVLAWPEAYPLTSVRALAWAVSQDTPQRSRLRLMFRGRLLNGSDRLREAGVGNGSTLFAVLEDAPAFVAEDPWLHAGAEVEALDVRRGSWRPGKVVAANRNGSGRVEIHWDSGLAAPDASLLPEQVRPRLLPSPAPP